MDTNEIYSKLNLLKFEDLYKYLLLKFIHSYGHQFNIFENFLAECLSVHSYSTRNCKLHIPLVTMENGKHMTFYKFIVLFNEVPIDCLLPQSSSKLKKYFRLSCMNKYCLLRRTS